MRHITHRPFDLPATHSSSNIPYTSSQKSLSPWTPSTKSQSEAAAKSPIPSFLASNLLALWQRSRRRACPRHSHRRHNGSVLTIKIAGQRFQSTRSTILRVTPYHSDTRRASDFVFRDPPRSANLPPSGPCPSLQADRGPTSAPVAPACRGTKVP